MAWVLNAISRVARRVPASICDPAIAPSPLFVPVAHKFKGPIIDLPKPGTGKSFRRIIHYPNEYTVEPLNTTNLAGRDPVTGRVIVGTLGGGIKHKYHWIRWVRDGPEEGPPREERIIQIMEDGCRSAHIALVAYEDDLKYIIATANMKAGDIIKTSRHLPNIPIRGREGDAYVLGALPIGTSVCCIERFPGQGGMFVQSAGTTATITRKEDNRVIVKMPSKREFSFDERCLAVIGRISNAIYSSIPIGSAQRLRWLGYRPRSGLWQRKRGIHGRKIKPPKKLLVLQNEKREREILTIDMRLK